MRKLPPQEDMSTYPTALHLRVCPGIEDAMDLTPTTNYPVEGNDPHSNRRSLPSRHHPCGVTALIEMVLMIAPPLRTTFGSTPCEGHCLAICGAKRHPPEPNHGVPRVYPLSVD